MTTSFLAPMFRHFLALSLIAASAEAAAPKVLPEGQLPNDARLEPLKDLDGYFPFTPPKSGAEWETRITGASGGGTQTMLRAAIDPRVTLSSFGCGLPATESLQTTIFGAAAIRGQQVEKFMPFSK